MGFYTMFFFGEDNIFLKVGVVNGLSPARVVFTLWAGLLHDLRRWLWPSASHLRADVQALVGLGSSQPSTPGGC